MQVFKSSLKIHLEMKHGFHISTGSTVEAVKLTLQQKFKNSNSYKIQKISFLIILLSKFAHQ